VAQLTVGDPRSLATDVGPVIGSAAREALLAHIDAMRALGHDVLQGALPTATHHGTFVAPTVIDLGGVDAIRLLEREVFGPVLHVVRWRHGELSVLIEAINATGYALTHGIESRIDETVEAILGRIQAGNVYVNRNIIGAVVGVQPFGGSGLSGTGPKAGGPFYLRRLVRSAAARRAAYDDDWLSENRLELAGPTGESNVLELHPRGIVACIAASENVLVAQARAAIGEGNTVLMLGSPAARQAAGRLAADKVTLVDTLDAQRIDVVLLDPDFPGARDIRRRLSRAAGKIVPILLPDPAGHYDWHRLVIERTVTINTAAAGGNTALLSLSEVTGV
jgi:RHH-type proline utilization regulon transcriptional repressor/proline dehydrogenase/delta 1-pyrroline-5-carboxylate dehydrogenase